MDPNKLIKHLRFLELRPRAYSGRGMYGKSCVAVVARGMTPFSIGVLLARQLVETEEVEELEELLGLDPSTDQLGHDTILYFPGVAWPDDEQRDALRLTPKTPNEGETYMSYDVDLKNEDGSVCLLDRPHQEGGTIAMGGQHEASMSVTYNYSEHLYRVIPGGEGLRGLHGRKASTTIPELATGIAQLLDNKDPDYWKATEGNVRHALVVLLAWAIAHPNGIWDVG